MESLWVEKYRPDGLEDMALADQLRKDADGWISKGEIPNLLFIGRPGTGKTTLARILGKKTNAVMLVIDASDDRGIDTIRNRVKTFAQTKTISDHAKIVFLDEADGLTKDAQNSLRNIMETFSDITRFILSVNIEEKIIEALHSRCKLVRFLGANEDQIYAKLENILLNEGVAFEPKDLNTLVERHFPDMRSMISVMENSIPDFRLVLPKIDVGPIIKGLLSKDLRKVRELSNGYDYNVLYRMLFDNLAAFPAASRVRILLTLAEYQFRNVFGLDKEINFVACAVKLMELI